MKRLVNVFVTTLLVFSTLFYVSGCNQQNEENEVMDGDSITGTGLNGSATLTMKVGLAKQFPAQIYDLYKQYFSEKLLKGDLWVQLCKDQACSEVVISKQGLKGYGFTVGFPKEVEISNLPAGHFFVKIGSDTGYSQEYNSTFEQDGGFGPFDILAVAPDSNPPDKYFNPKPYLYEVDLKDGETKDLGTVRLGSLIFKDISFPPKPEDGYLLVASSGKDYRNVIRTVDLSTYKVAHEVTLKLNGSDFDGDICGFVRDPDDASKFYVLAIGNFGSYVFLAKVSDGKVAFSGKEVLIPHPDYDPQNPNKHLSSESYPRMCRGTVVKKGSKKFLYLVARGLGTTAGPYPLVSLDVTNMENGQASILKKYDQSVDKFYDSQRLLRRIVTDGNSLFALEPSWSKHVQYTTIYKFKVNDDGSIEKVKDFEAGTANDQCDSSTHWDTDIFVAPYNGSMALFVGTDDSIMVFDTDGNKKGEIDTSNYGRLIASFALSVDGKTLYAIPNCKSADVKGKLNKGISSEQTDVDRYAIVALDLASTSDVPELTLTDTNFDDNDTPDGGIDLAYTYLKKHILRWVGGGTGVLPPIVYIAPEIVAGKNSIFLRGSGVQGSSAGGLSDVSASGLGQVGDIGVFDITSKYEGIIFRHYIPWLNGPSGKWGLDLDPDHKYKKKDDEDLSTGAILYLPKSK